MVIVLLSPQLQKMEIIAEAILALVPDAQVVGVSSVKHAQIAFGEHEQIHALGVDLPDGDDMASYGDFVRGLRGTHRDLSMVSISLMPYAQAFLPGWGVKHFPSDTEPETIAQLLVNA